MKIYNKYNDGIYTVYEIFGIKIVKKHLDKYIDSLLNNHFSLLSFKVNALQFQNKVDISLISMTEQEKKDKLTIKESRKERIIISLTSYPQRIGCIYVTLYSLFSQKIKPDKIVLWLSKEEFSNAINDIPKNILKFLDFGLEIEFVDKNLLSYNKLIYSLKKYPDDIIVTADDDIYYPPEWLERLYNAYLEEPNYIHCHRAIGIKFNKKNKILNYKKWDWNLKWDKSSTSYLNFFTGVGGVLYKSSLLHKDIFNEELFMKLAPKEDDVWFWAMAVLQGTKINVVKNNIIDVIEVGYPYYYRLSYYNHGEDSGVKGYSNSDLQIKNVIDYYGSNIMNKLLNMKE